MHEQPPGFAVSAEEHDDHVHVIPRGELDLATASELERHLRERIEAGGRVVLDLRELAFMDSSGVRVLVTAHRDAEAHDSAELTIVSPGERSPVSRVLSIAGITEQLGMVDG